MERWEYKTEYLSSTFNCIDISINIEVRDGWELVQIHQEGDRWYGLFRRLVR